VLRYGRAEYLLKNKFGKIGQLLIVIVGNGENKMVGEMLKIFRSFKLNVLGCYNVEYFFCCFVMFVHDKEVFTIVTFSSLYKCFD